MAGNETAGVPGAAAREHDHLAPPQGGADAGAALGPAAPGGPPAADHWLRAAYEELKTRHAELEGQIAAINVPAVGVDADLMVRWYTPAAGHLIPLQPGDRGRPLAALAPALAGDLAAVAGRVLARAGPVENEVADGDGRTFLRRAAPYWAGGAVAGVVLTFWDVTRRAWEGQALRRLNEQPVRRVADRTRDVRGLVALIQNAHDAIYTQTPDGTITAWNPGAERLYGYTAAEAIGRPADVLVPPDCRAGLREKDRALLRGEPVAAFETRRLHKDGRAVAVSVAISPVSDAAGRVVGIASIGRDVTARKQVEQALRASEERIRTILRAAADAIITIDRSGRIDAVNPAGERMFGYAAAELVGRHVNTLMPSPGRDAPDGDLARCLATWEKHPIGPGREVEGRHKDGTVFPVELTVSEIVHTGTFTGIIRDVGDRRRAEVARQQLAARLTTITEDERGRISRELHDETSQHLAGLIAGLKAVRLQPEVGAATARTLERLQEQADLIGRAVHRIAWELRPAALDAVGLDAALRSWVDRWAGWTGVAVNLHSSLGPDRLPPEVETQLYRLITEALANVAKHARASRVALLLDRRRDGVVVSVEDNGVGFDPAAVAPPGGRAGLGLLGMRERAALLGGTFQVEAAPGRGTTVVVRVPLPLL